MKRITYKNIKLILCIFLASSLTMSCKKQLDTNPLDKFANDTFWSSETNARIAITGLYKGEIQMNSLAEFSPSDWWSYHGLLYLEFASDNAYDRRGDNSAFNKLSDGTLTSNIGILSNYWTLSYKRIARANFFLENVDKTPVSPELLARFRAEARFIRACQYFYLSQYWGDAPLVTKTLTADEANHVIKNKKQELVAFVERELQEAANDLPSYGKLPAAERGRATKQAAYAFLGRLQLAEKSYAAAIKTYENIINANENSIDPNYTSLFDGSNESSKEIIFATQYLVDLAGNGMFQHNFPAIAGGWHLHCPLGSLVESYTFTDGTAFSYTDPRYNSQNITQNRDPRLGFTIISNGDRFKNLRYISHPDSTLSIDQLTTTKQATRTGYGLRKFNAENFSGNLQNSGTDLPIIRYAEVLLSYLEAKLENGDPLTAELMDKTINAVRRRSSVNMPPIAVANVTIVRAALRNERRVELALEGIRYWDLLRWDTAKDVLNGDFYGAAFPDAKNIRVKAGSSRDSYSRWYVTKKSFRAGQDNHWPIPQSEIDINPNLK
ncbi:RagB/SusD family nutrient uptake outer membrane protein [Sphingobacterium detergens]|uniref:Putative outer membrane starch-binding protein n=1 Tax=Sphingobacterium detergens TaxID=1145106 RepID=A0A420ARK8_SPHD1|nr:RagB/SusD family nutrient uptake outer membrane protein [Sphingobacterium detergens]RKE47065.1 putative outer membrane starch-binding protein [Sphingobacterium detergens]